MNTLVRDGRVEDAVPFLSEALLKLVSDLITTIMGYVNVCLGRGDHDSYQAILNWGIELLLRLREADKPNYFNRVNAALWRSITEREGPWVKKRSRRCGALF